MLTDSHAHLTGENTSTEAAEAMIAAATASGVTTIVNICTDINALERGLALAERYPSFYNVASTHPQEVANEKPETFDLFAGYARSGAIVAIGETGLDYYYKEVPQDLQHHYLRRYLRLAAECQLPVVFHCREAFNDLFRIADEEPPCSAVLHCFSGNAGDAAEVLARGWYISFSGILTYKKNEELRTIAQTVPLERILIETDSPYLPPQSRRGKPNQPAYLVETAQLLADLREISLTELAEATASNVRRLMVGIC